jgi:hypothetical protein
MHSFRGILLGLALAFAAIPAHAQGRVDNIGNGGGVVISGERLAGVYHTTNTATFKQENLGGTSTTSESETESRTTTVALFGHDPGSPTEIPRLALDYFVVGGFSVGGSFSFMRNATEIDRKQTTSVGGSSQSSTRNDGRITQQAFVFHPRLGYALAFNEYVGIWPRAGFSYTHIERRDAAFPTDPDVEQKTTITLTNLTLEGLLFVSPFSNFALVGGPFADIGLGGSTEIETNQGFQVPDGENKVSALGFIVGVAGYFDTR